MLFLSQRTCRRLFLAGAIASSLVFSNHALAASPEHIAPLAILSTADGTTVDLTNIILHDGSGVPIPKDATMAVYVATTAPVSSLHFSGIDMYGSGGVLDYAYQDGNGFQPLTVTTDSGASFTRTRADGTADVTFALPASWSTTTLAEDSLHRSAYWIRITARTPYEKIPFVKKLDATVFTTQATFVQDSFGGYNGLVRATPTAGCGSDAAVLREAAATNGVHWFVVRTSAPTCTLTVSPPGFLSTTFSAKTFTGAAQTVTASIPLQHRMVVTVLDEQGLPVSDAYPSFDGLLPDAQQGGKYYFGNEDTVNARLIVRRSGYVTEDGHGQNSALYHISGGTAYQQTTIIFTPNSPACSSAIVPGVITYCALMTPNTTVVTLDSGRATSTAAVTIYTDAARTTMADDVSRIGSNDAGFISNSNGEMTFALREGTYYYIATALGAPATIGNFIVLPDVPTTLKVDYWPQAPLNPTVSPTASSVRVYGPNAVYADRDAVLVVITVKEGASYRLPDSTLQISVSSTISVAPTTPAANDVAEWYLALRSTRPAFTHIFATADDIALADAPILTFLTPPPIQDGRVSATQSLVAISGNSAPADNSTVRTLTVTVRNAGPSVISGKTVSIATACTGVTIQPSTAMTDSIGVASFTIKGSVADDCIFSATADRVPLVKTASLTFGTFAGCPVVGAGSLVKLPDDHDPATQSDTAVYYVGNDCKRHAFSNAHVYESWYQSFDTVLTVSAAQLASISLGKNVIYKPGVRLVKFLSLNNVYSVATDGKLRWVSSETVAEAGYGANWNKSVDDISDAFYGDYAFGDDLIATTEITSELQQSAGVTIDTVL